MTRRATVVPAGPRLTRPMLSGLPVAAGRWLVRSNLRGMRFGDYADLGPAGVVAAIYLITDSCGCVRWLGQAARDDDLVGRLGEHAADPVKAPVFVTLRYLHLVDATPPHVVDVIEGRCADLLGLRGAMGPRRWPRSHNWVRLVA